MAGKKTNLTDQLKKYFGFDTFKGNQEAIIQNLLDGNDTFVLMPTGGGKSLCYQLPSLLMEGTGIVISPLIALMKNQVDAMRNFSEDDGIAHFINSSLNKSAIDQVKSDILSGKTKLLYVAPESLTKEENVEFLKTVKISFYAVDEAHCISEWGHDFRPEYTQMGVLHQQFPQIPIVALTATADKITREDIVRQLHLNHPRTFISSFDRPNISLTVKRVFQAKEKNKAILEFIHRHGGESGIIYCMSRNKTETVAQMLQKQGIRCGVYHAGLSTQHRDETQNDFINDRIQVVCATIAFGMGIDKSNVRYVIHYNMPQSMENYYQEAGRAGRDGENSQCVLLFSAQDVIIDRMLLDNKDFSDVDEEDEFLIRQRDIRRLQIMEGYCKTTGCLRNYILEYFGEKTFGPCDNCGNCHREYHETDMTREAKWVVNCVAETRGRYGLTIVLGTLLGAKRARLRELGADKYKSYGALNDHSEAELRALISQMTEMGYLYQTQERYSVLKLGDISPLRDENTHVIMRTYEEKEPDKKKKPQKSVRKRSTDALTAAGYDLFEALRKLRLEIAKEEAMPPYIVFSDKTLIDMCIKCPSNEEEMLEVSGVGENKLKKYGQRFLEEIQKFCLERPNAVLSMSEDENGNP